MQFAFLGPEAEVGSKQLEQGFCAVALHGQAATLFWPVWGKSAEHQVSAPLDRSSYPLEVAFSSCCISKEVKSCPVMPQHVLVPLERCGGNVPHLPAHCFALFSQPNLSLLESGLREV